MFWIPLTVLLAGLLLDGWVAASYATRNAQRLTYELDRQSREAIDVIKVRLSGFEKGIRGTRGAILVGGQEHITAATYDIYAASRNPDVEFPGVRGFGFIRRLGNESATGYVAEMRRIVDPGFTLQKMEEGRGERDILEFISPSVGLADLVGLNIAAVERQREAALLAVRSGHATMTAPDMPPPGSELPNQWFLILLPIYRPGAPIDTLVGRETETLGWAFAASDLDTALRGIDLRDDLELDLSDVTNESAPVHLWTLGRLTSTEAVALDRITKLTLYGRTWQFSARAGRLFVANLNPVNPTTVFCAGAVLSTLLSVVAALLISAARRREDVRRDKADHAYKLQRDLQTITDALPSMIGYWDKDMVLRLANKAYRAWFGQSGNTIIGLHCSDFMTPEQIESGRARHLAALRGEIVEFDLDSQERIDVPCRHFRVHYIPDLVAGTVHGFYIMAHDITELSKSRAELKTLVRDNQALIKTVHQHALVSVADHRGLIVEVNDAFCALSGYTREELLGHDHRIVNSETHPREFWQGMWSTVARGESWRAEVCNRNKDGTLYWVDSMITPFTDEHGRIIKYISIRFDISPLKAAEKKLGESKAFLERAEEIAGVGGVQVDLESGRQTWTPQTFKIHDIKGDVAPTLMELDALTPPHSRATLQQAMQIAARTGKGYDIEIPMTTALGRTIWVRNVGEVEAHDGRPARLVGAIQDITQRKMAEETLRTVSDRLALATDAAGMGVWELDLVKNAFHWDAQMYQIYDRPRSGEVEPYATWVESLHPEDRLRTEQELHEALNGGWNFETEFRILWSDGEIHHLKAAAQVQYDAARVPVRMVGVNFDITKRKAAETQLALDARCDKLTGLANRALFMEWLGKAVDRVSAGEQALFGVLFLDFDRFKLINDTLGHEAGDELLRQIAKRLRTVLRASDAMTLTNTGNVVSRFGGDEFLILLNDLRDSEDAAGIAERLLNALAPAYDIRGGEVHSSASIGIVTSGRRQASAEEVVRNADLAMYEAKRAGRACSVVFDESMLTRLTRHVTIENSLRRALGTAELYLVYQPIIELATGRMISAEALVRWQHPHLGAVSPAEFIPIAEESGLIVELDRWVQKEACHAMVAWRERSLDLAPQTVSVNLSRAELALGTQLLEQVRGTLEKAGLPAQCLQLEVTEREVMRQPEAAHALMRKLQVLGVKIAMDDFGTGTSSLGFLRNFQFDTIKIDQSFVKDLAGSQDALAVMHATINLIENLGMASLVEGVEEPAQAAILQSLGCRYAQGYLFRRPVRAADLLEVPAMAVTDGA